MLFEKVIKRYDNLWESNLLMRESNPTKTLHGNKQIVEHYHNASNHSKYPCVYHNSTS